MLEASTRALSTSSFILLLLAFLVYMRLTIISYNPLSAANGRLEEISHLAPHADVILLQGTQLKRQEFEVEKKWTPNHTCYGFGHDRGALTNRSAGVAVLLASELAPHVIESDGPSKFLAGRGGMIRVRHDSKQLDIALITLYYPARPTTARLRPGYLRTVHA